MTNKIQYLSNSTEETIKIGCKLGTEVKSRLLNKEKYIIIGINGPLGSGKTTFIKGLAKSLGITTPVTSPPYQLVNNYQSSSIINESYLKLYHIDLYRINSLSEFNSLAIDDFIYGKGTVTIIEWADKALQILPDDIIAVKISVKGTGDRAIVVIL